MALRDDERLAITWALRQREPPILNGLLATLALVVDEVELLDALNDALDTLSIADRQWWYDATAEDGHLN